MIKALPQNISFAEFELDRDRRRLLRNGEPVVLNSKTFALLEFLLERSGSVVSKDEILEAVWPGQFVEEANLSVQISALRKALGEKTSEPRFLVTVPGVGYKFVADVRISENEIVIERRTFEHIQIDEELRGENGSRLLSGSKPNVSSYDISLRYSGAGDKELALDWLERAYDEHSSGMVAIDADVLFDNIRNEPRFIELRRKVGLPPL